MMATRIAHLPRARLASCHPRLGVLALVLLGAACYDPSRSVAEGVGEPTVLATSDVHVVGTSESIAEVQDLEVLPDGSVWVLNSLEPFFLGFGPEGTLREVYGDEGGGPEEFRLPTSFVTGGTDGDAWVFDLRRHSLVRIAGADVEWAEVSLASDSLPPGSVVGGMSMMGTTVRTARLGDEIVLPRTTASMDSGIAAFRMQTLRPDLLALDPATASVRHIVGLAEVMEDPAADFERTSGAFPLWYRLWAACGDDRIHVHDRVRNEIRTFAADGTELDPIPLPPVPFTEVTPRQFALAIFPLRLAELQGQVGGDVTPTDSLNLLNRMADIVEGTPAQLAAYLPRYVDFRCADDGTLWIQPYDLELGALSGGRAWLRITPDGATDEVHLPERFDAFRFTADRIWGVQRDELDVASLAWIEIP